MQIHELNTFSGAMNSDTFVAVDNGSDTGKTNVPTLIKPAMDAIAEANERIDNIIAGGAAPSEAEIIDARTGAGELGGIAYPSLGAAIRGQIGKLYGNLTEFEDGFHNLNLFGSAILLKEDGYASIENGHIVYSNMSGLNAYLLPVDGESLYTFTKCRFAFLVDADKYTAMSNLFQDVTVVDSTGASYICFSVNYNNYPLSDYGVSKGATLQEGYELPGWFNVLDEKVYNLEYISGVNLFDRAELIKENGYASIDNGHLSVSNLANYNAYVLPVDGKSVYTFTSCRFAFLLDSDKYTAIGSLLENVSEVDSTGGAYICFSFNYNSYPVADYKIYGNIDVSTKSPYGTIKGALSSNGNLRLTNCKTNLRKGERITFGGKITSFSSLKIGLSNYAEVSTPANQRNTFLIDGTNVSYYETNGSTPVVVPHGLTITNNIQIIIEVSDVATCKFTLISNGELFSHEFAYKRNSIGNPYVLSINTTLTDCAFSWTCLDINKKIWIFGDSYLAYSPQRWTYYLHEHGYDKNTLLDGFPGEGSVNGRVSFNNLLAFNSPKYAVWCLGMNDGPDSGSVPAIDWSTNRDLFLQYCQTNKITPIFGTIPTVPNINHEEKNAWIRSSGYRYIDFAAAVGADSDGVWYSGMLSDDNVHPTENGARALFAQVLIDLPEIMISDFGY